MDEANRSNELLDQIFKTISEPTDAMRLELGPIILTSMQDIPPSQLEVLLEEVRLLTSRQCFWFSRVLLQMYRNSVVAASSIVREENKDVRSRSRLGFTPLWFTAAAVPVVERLYEQFSHDQHFNHADYGLFDFMGTSSMTFLSVFDELLDRDVARGTVMKVFIHNDDVNNSLDVSMDEQETRWLGANFERLEDYMSLCRQRRNSSREYCEYLLSETVAKALLQGTL